MFFGKILVRQIKWVKTHDISPNLKGKTGKNCSPEIISNYCRHLMIFCFFVRSLWKCDIWKYSLNNDIKLYWLTIIENKLKTAHMMKFWLSGAHRSSLLVFPLPTLHSWTVPTLQSWEVCANNEFIPTNVDWHWINFQYMESNASKMASSAMRRRRMFFSLNV